MSSENHADNELGPLQPHKKPRKAAKVVLAGLVAAAAGGAAIIAITSLSARPTPTAGTEMPTTLRSQTQPGNAAQTTQPATPKVSAGSRSLPGVWMAPVTLNSETQPSNAAADQK